jgi:hypothetical protein
VVVFSPSPAKKYLGNMCWHKYQAKLQSGCLVQLINHPFIGDQNKILLMFMINTELLNVTIDDWCNRITPI